MHDVQIIEPTAFQAKVMAVPEMVDLFLGGGRGGGKSHNISLLILRHLELYREKARVLFVRKSYKGLADFELVLRGIFSQAYGSRASYNSQEHVWRLPYGYVELAQIDGPKDYDKVQGRSFTLIVVDELTQWADPFVIDMLRSNLRGPQGIPLRTIYAANPGNVGHQWVASRYVLPSKQWAPFQLEHGGWCVQANSTFRDNPHLDHEDYLRQGNRDQLNSLIDATQAKVEIRRESLWNNLKDVPAPSRDVAIAQGLAAFRGDIKKQTADARTAHVRSAAEMRATAIAAKPHYRSPAQMLARYTLGSEKRSRIMQQIENSGPAELLSLAELAAATGDKDLGAALASRVFSLAPEKRPFDVNELANAIVGEEWREISKALDEVETMAVDIARRDRDFETGRADGTNMIEQTLRQQQAEALYAEEGDDDEA
ncbi:hypothetical protein L288_18540 [Sphingobium quisquiliarum P25]|uniref:Phage terminase large subunit N-terminal domain-containing protein n=1 Tax=Sphingobium quisquiliarum P25 TaxID=1329909 RepID=T0GHR5_9SPHN|nr:phage terminase large subunit [Sphingobium quisquiliarum]EQB00237.1 hypothetical protein L288_18540 [Sphingobium quisquiliarum P25]